VGSDSRSWLILALGVVTTGFGVAFAAAATDNGKISLPNQEVSGVLTAIGGGIVGAVISIMVARAADRETLTRITSVLEGSLTSSLRSENSRLASARQLWHHYYPTTLRGEHVWRYEQYPFHLSAHIGSLAVEIDVQTDNSLNQKYLVEAFVRHERLTIVSRKVGDEANVFVEVYPQFDGELSEYFGVGFVRTWDATNIVTKVILSRLPLVPTTTEGTLAAEFFPVLDEMWERNFTRLNQLQLERTLPGASPGDP
jgi:hypothetical protein